ncbi:hypothetical protein Tco_1460147, partial [Tanacetum coccineum]
WFIQRLGEDISKLILSGNEMTGFFEIAITLVLSQNIGQNLNILDTKDQDWEYLSGLLPVRYISEPIIGSFEMSFNNSGPVLSVACSGYSFSPILF